jgi:UDP-N-acetylmuramoyl-tripeptide--D-alanyl-D-alanine ligase
LGGALHREIGEYARDKCDTLIAIGGLAAEAATAFGGSALRFADVESARAELEPKLASGVTVLIKGSRVMGLERLARALEAGAN